MDTYLTEIARQRGIAGPIPPIRTYTERNEFTTFGDDQIPLAVVISPGLAGEPSADGEGRYNAWWSLGVGIVAAASTENLSSRIAKIYGAAARAVLLQNQALDSAWEYGGIHFADESYDDVPDPEQERTMRAARLVFRVWVMNVTTKFAGPASPAIPDPGQPGSDWPTVTKADVTVKVVEEV